MLTEKENYLMALRGQVPEWVPRLLVASPGKPAANIWVRPSFLNARRTPTGGYDIFGVEYCVTKETGYQALPVPGKFILDDIRRWRDVIKVPDISDIDWETMAKKDLSKIDRTQTAVCASIHVGYFQSLMNFMGFNEGLCALFEEPDECMELFEYLSKFYDKIASKVRDHYKPDVWNVTDDTATANAPFISPTCYREMIKPFHASDTKYAREMGIPIDMHDCGKCEVFIEDWLDFGVTAWNPAQVTNDLLAIKKKYGNKFVLEGCWDSQGPAGWLGTSEEVVKQAVRDCIDTYATDGGFVFWASTYGAPDNQEYLDQTRWITEEYDAYGRTFYKKQI